MSINEEFNKFIQDDPKNLFNMNASSYIRNKSVPLISALELYGIKLKYLYKMNRMSIGSEPYVGQKLNLIKKIKFN